MYHFNRVRLANFLAPVASESDMGGPIGWLAGFMNGFLDSTLEVSVLYHNFRSFAKLLATGEHDGCWRVFTK
jgi:hypothetical protein